MSRFLIAMVVGLSLSLLAPGASAAEVTRSAIDRFFADSLQIGPDGVDFGVVEQGDVAIRELWVSNATARRVSVSAWIEGDFTGAFSVTSHCRGSLEPGDACRLELEYAPVDLCSDVTARLVVKRDLGGTVVRELSGRCRLH